jgi:hypothetical protein
MSYVYNNYRNLIRIMLGEAPVKIYATAQKNLEIPMGQQEQS